jgi:RimJ/RimL family protein N-acetyltransferase
MSSHVQLRDVIADDLPIFFEQQLDPEATRMADFTPRDRDAFMTHWTTKVLVHEAASVRTILYGTHVAGNIVCWEQDGRRLIGYWLGQEFWGKGIATQALAMFLLLVTARPLYAYVAQHNLASRRVLEKCGFTLTLDDTTASDIPADTSEEYLFVLPDEGVRAHG